MKNNIPMAWYFDNAVFKTEVSNLFEVYPKYMGHRLMVPRPDDFLVLERENNGLVLFNHSDYYSLLSNICRHHQALLLKGKGNTKKIICQAHRWAYDNQGELTHAPQFEENPCLNLNNRQLKEWLGLLFHEKKVSPPELSMELKARFDFKNYEFNQINSQVYPFNWKIFMEVYLDNYHIPAIHPGLRNMIDVHNQRWTIDKDYSSQCVKLSKNLNKHGSEPYKLYQQIIKDYLKTDSIDMDILWLAVYPNIMIEHYPFMFVISTVKPISNTECINYVEYYFDSNVLNEFPEFAAIAMAAYSETAKEDAEICELINDGRKFLNEEHENQSGPPHPLMEKGLSSFYQFLHLNISMKEG